MATESTAMFRAVALSTRPIHQLLKCINFAPRAHIQITPHGIRFTSDHARVMQGVAFLDQALFSAYATNLPPGGDEEDDVQYPSFQISLSSLLETLQIFGAVDIASKAQKAEQDPYRSNLRNYRPDAFSHQALGISGTCTLLYAEEGDSFKVTIEESGIKTTAALTTYLPDMPEDIPFDRDAIMFSFIMPGRFLLDSLSEIAPTAPNRLNITASKSSPYLTLTGTGDLGKSAVDFARGRELFEKFQIGSTWSQSFKFDFIKNSTEAMRVASKVCIRGDDQGVLSLQFIVEMEAGKTSFLDFRFVPFIHHDDDEESGEDGGDCET